jgi:hypothetical protein
MGPAADGEQSRVDFPPADFRGGDNPADHPGMSRAPQHAPIIGDDIMSPPGIRGATKYDPPTTIEVGRPERTNVRDVDATLPIAPARSALLLVLAMLGNTLMQARFMPWAAAATRHQQHRAVDQGARIRGPLRSASDSHGRAPDQSNLPVAAPARASPLESVVFAAAPRMPV